MVGILKSLYDRYSIARKLANTRTSAAASLAQGAAVLTVSDPFSNDNLGTTTYTTFGTVPAQFILSGKKVLLTSTAMVSGQTYSVGILATSGDGRQLIGTTYYVTAGGAATPTPTPAPTPTPTPTPTPPAAGSSTVTLSRDLTLDADQTVNPPHFNIALPSIAADYSWVNAVATFTYAQDSGFTTPKTLIVTLDESVFDSETYGITRKVDIDLGQLLDNVAAGAFYLKCSVAVPKTDASGSQIIASNVYSALLNSPATTINITDAPDVTEGNSGTTLLKFPVSSTGALGYERRVSWTAVGITNYPLTASDFVGGVMPTGVLTIPADQATSEIVLQVKGDTSVEQDEAVKIVLSNVLTKGYPGMPDVVGTVGADAAQGSVINDDVSAYTTTLRWVYNDNSSASIQNNGVTAVGFGDSGVDYSRPVKAGVGKQAGKWFVEMTIDRVADNPIIGFNHDGFNQYAGHYFGFGASELGTNYGNNGNPPYSVFFSNAKVGELDFHKTGDVICQAWDLDNQYVYISVNGVWKIGNPATPGSGINISSRGTTIIYPACMVSSKNGGGDIISLTAISTPPTGYSYI